MPNMSKQERKVVVIGAGFVGTTYVYALAKNQGVKIKARFFTLRLRSGQASFAQNGRLEIGSNNEDSTAHAWFRG